MRFVELAVLAFHGAAQAEGDVVGLHVGVFFENEVDGRGHLPVVHVGGGVEEVEHVVQDEYEHGAGRGLAPFATEPGERGHPAAEYVIDGPWRRRRQVFLPQRLARRLLDSRLDGVVSVRLPLYRCSKIFGEVGGFEYPVEVGRPPRSFVSEQEGRVEHALEGLLDEFFRTGRCGRGRSSGGCRSWLLCLAACRGRWCCNNPSRAS